MNKTLIARFAILLTLTGAPALAQQATPLDGIAAVAEEDVILKSELEETVNSFLDRLRQQGTPMPSDEQLKEIALSLEKIQGWLEGKTPRKVIVVKGKLVSIVL